MEQANAAKIPELRTRRLLLRHLEQEDAALIFSLRANETVNRYLERKPATELQEAVDFISMIHGLEAQDKSLTWVLCSEEGETAYGTVCLWNFTPDRSGADIGYEQRPEYGGRGYMQEAVAEVCRYAFAALGLTHVDGYTHKDNKASSRLLERLGFRLTDKPAGEPEDHHVLYRLTREEFEAQREK